MHFLNFWHNQLLQLVPIYMLEMDENKPSQPIRTAVSCVKVRFMIKLHLL